MDEIESLCRLCEAGGNSGAIGGRRLKLQERILPLRMLNMYNWRSPSQRIAEKRDASFSIGCAGYLPSTNGNMPNGYSPTHLPPGMEMSIWALHSILLKRRV